mgnify:CR=1 FL=1
MHGLKIEANKHLGKLVLDQNTALRVFMEKTLAIRQNTLNPECWVQ